MGQSTNESEDYWCGDAHFSRSSEEALWKWSSCAKDSSKNKHLNWSNDFFVEISYLEIDSPRIRSVPAKCYQKLFNALYSRIHYWSMTPWKRLVWTRKNWLKYISRVTSYELLRTVILEDECQLIQYYWHMSTDSFALKVLP